MIDDLFPPPSECSRLVTELKMGLLASGVAPQEWGLIIHSRDCIKKQDCLECKHHKFRDVKTGLNYYMIRQLMLSTTRMYCPINPSKIKRQPDGTLDRTDAEHLLDEAKAAHDAQGVAVGVFESWKVWKPMLLKYLVDMRKGDLVYHYMCKRVWAVGEVLDNEPRLEHLSAYPEDLVGVATAVQVLSPPLPPSWRVEMQGEEYIFPHDVQVGLDTLAPGAGELWRCNWAVRRVRWTWLFGGLAVNQQRKTFVSLGGKHGLQA